MPGLAGAVQRPRRLPAGPRALRGPSPGRPGPAARRRSRRTTSCSPWARPCSGSTPSSPARSCEEGTRVAMVSQEAAEVHRSTADLAVLAAPGPVCDAARADRARPRRGASGAVPASRALPEPPAAGEPLRAAHVFDALAERLRARRDRDRGVALEPAGAARAAAGARVARLPQPGDGRARVRAARRRPGSAWRGPTGPSSRSSGTGRRSTRSRRSGAPPTTAPGRCS